MNLVNLAKRLWEAFDADDQGATLTEFVICLPVFILTFGAMLSLAVLGEQSVVNKTATNKLLWEKTYAAEDDKLNMSPRGDFKDMFEKFTDDSNDDAVNQLLGGVQDLASAAGGHWGSSYAGATVIAPAVTGDFIGSSKFSGLSLSSANTKPGDLLDKKATLKPMEDYMLGDTTMAPLLVDDSLAVDKDFLSRAKSGDGAWGAVDFVAGAVLKLLGAVPGVFAGMRYGDVQVEKSHTVSVVGGQEFTFDSQYSSLISPKPVTAGSQMPGQGEVPGDQQEGMLSPDQKAYMFLWVFAQPKCHYRKMLNLLAPEFSDCSDSFTVKPYRK